MQYKKIIGFIVILCFFLFTYIDKIWADEYSKPQKKKMSDLLKRPEYKKLPIENTTDKPKNIDPNPEGKIIDHIDIYTFPPFPINKKPKDWIDRSGNYIFHTLNAIHITTWESVVVKEIIFKKGEKYNKKKINENKRALKEIKQFSDATIYPIKHKDPKKVNIIVVTRDLFPYQFNFDFKYVGGQPYAKIACIYRNVLGLHKELEFNYIYQVQRTDGLAIYRDHRFLGSPLDISLTGGLYWYRWMKQLDMQRLIAGDYYDQEYDDFTKGGNLRDGYLLDILITNPLRTKYDHFYFSIWYQSTRGNDRKFIGNELKPVYFRNDGNIVPDSDMAEILKDNDNNLPNGYLKIPYRGYKYKKIQSKFESYYSFGDDWRLDLGGGFYYGDSEYDFLDELQNVTNQEPNWKADYKKYIFPRYYNNYIYLLIGQKYLIYNTYQNLNKFRVDEIIQLGYSITFRIGRADKKIGANENFNLLIGELTYGIDILKRFLITGEHTASTQFSDHDRDQPDYEGRFYEIRSENILRFYILGLGPGYLVTMGTFQYARRTKPIIPYFIGGGEGLRGYDAAFMSGNRVIRFAEEYRTLPIKIKFFDLGFAFFHETATAWYHLGEKTHENTKFYHTVGMGLRFIFLAINPNMGSLDFGYGVTPLADGTHPYNVSFAFSQPF